MSKKEIIYLVPNVSQTSIPVDIARNLAKQGLEFSFVIVREQKDKRRLKFFEDRKNVEVIELNLTSLVFLPVKLYKLINIFDSRLEVIHSHHILSNMIGKILSKIKDSQLIISNHSIFESFSIIKKIERFLTAKKSILIYNSKSTLKSFPSFFKKKSEDNLVIYNGVDFEKIDFKKNKKRQIIKKDFKINILIASRFVKNKGVLDVLRVLSKYDQEKTGIHLVGAGPQKKDIITFLQKNEVENVFYYGFLQREKLYSLMHETDVFILNSEYEGFCNTAVEAAYAGNIIFSRDIEPITSEVIGKNAYYFSDLNEIPGFLKDIEQNLENFTKESLKKRLRNRFNLDNIVKKYIDLYEEIAKS